MNSQGCKLLSVENLSVFIPYGKGRVRPLEKISLNLEPGRTLAVVGESGSGKSMLCRALMGILPARSQMAKESHISFHGVELTSMPEKERRRFCGRNIGLVLQNPISSLNPVLRVGQQVMEPMQQHLGLSAEQSARRAVELLHAVGILQAEERFRSFPHELSGGMRQRVAIAVALSCDPKVLIADEPTTALDVTVQAEILYLLATLQKERGMGILLVSHNLSVVAGMAHETAVMYAGRIVEHAATSVLFSRMRMPYTRALFDSIPRLDHPPHLHLKSIDGNPPVLSASMRGCPFAPRCGLAAEKCREEEPPLTVESAGNHRYACWFPLQSPAGEAL